MSGSSTLWGFEVSSPSVLLLPQQPCSVSSGSKERQTLHPVSELGYQQGPSPHRDILQPWEVQPSPATSQGHLPHHWWPLPGQQLLRVMEQAERMSPDL